MSAAPAARRDHDTSTEAQYADVLELLTKHGYSAGIADTGGGCEAIEIVVDDDHRLLATDKEGLLATERHDHKGWTIGLYVEDELLADVNSNDGSLKGLLNILDQLDGHVANQIGHYIMLVTRHPGAPDWQKKVDSLWSYCSAAGKIDIYRQGYAKAQQALGLDESSPTTETL